MAARRPTPRTKPPAEPPIPNATERFWAGVYGSLITRYIKLDTEWTVAMTATKLCAKRFGLDRMLEMLLIYGVPVVAERCRHEMTVRQEFFASMLAKYPSNDRKEMDGAIEEMAAELAVADSPGGTMRLLRYLDRLKQREIMLNAIKTAVH